MTDLWRKETKCWISLIYFWNDFVFKLSFRETMLISIARFNFWLGSTQRRPIMCLKPGRSNPGLSLDLDLDWEFDTDIVAVFSNVLAFRSFHSSQVTRATMVLNPMHLVLVNCSERSKTMTRGRVGEREPQISFKFLSKLSIIVLKSSPNTRHNNRDAYKPNRWLDVP